jgi:uncharacterized protein (DUF2344 family)
MNLVKADKSEVILEHKDRNGKKHKVTLTVDQRGSKFIKDHIENLTYDIAGKVIRVSNNANGTTLPRVMAIELGNIPADRNVFFKDGDKTNLRVKNFAIAE